MKAYRNHFFLLLLLWLLSPLSAQAAVCDVDKLAKLFQASECRTVNCDLTGEQALDIGGRVGASRGTAGDDAAARAQ